MKLTYQRGMFVLYKLTGKRPSESSIIGLHVVTPTAKEHFFGYYDKSPWNQQGTFMLTLEVSSSKRHPGPKDQATIGLIDTSKDNCFIPITSTSSWNLQQGCMVQWLGPDFSENIIYNDLINGNYVSIIMNVQTGVKKILERPIYSVSKDGGYALSLNFSRLHRLRPGYGYSNLPDHTKGILHPEDDGIWLLDLKTNKSNLIISLDDIVKIDWNQTMDGAEHRFNHLEFNPAGTRFSFLHRWEYKGETYSRLFTANRDGTEIYCLAQDKMVSHSCWKNDQQILVWARQHDIGDRYFLFTDLTGDREVIGEGILTHDGHPSYSPDGRYILTDTYPDRTRYRTLIIYDTKENKRYDIGKFFATFKYVEETRCDLHPRWSRDGRKICFDSVHEGKRQLYVIDNPFSQEEVIK